MVDKESLALSDVCPNKPLAIVSVRNIDSEWLANLALAKRLQRMLSFLVIENEFTPLQIMFLESKKRTQDKTSAHLPLPLVEVVSRYFTTHFYDLFYVVRRRSRCRHWLTTLFAVFTNGALNLK